MLELRTAELRFLVFDDRAPLRLDDHALLCVASPMLASAGGGDELQVDPVFAVPLAPGELHFSSGRGAPLLAIAAHGDDAAALRSGLITAGGVAYLPPMLQIGLYWLQREARQRGALPQSHLVALSTIAAGWIRALPRLTALRRSRGLAPPRTQRLVHRLRSAIATDLAQRLTLDELALRVEASRAQLNRAFRHATGLSVARYRRELRLRCAAVHLLDDQARCGSVAQALGFASPGQFSIDFRRLYGVVPSRTVSLIDALIGVAAPG